MSFLKIRKFVAPSYSILREFAKLILKGIVVNASCLEYFSLRESRGKIPAWVHCVTRRVFLALVAPLSAAGVMPWHSRKPDGVGVILEKIHQSSGLANPVPERFRR
jgi:hypothetical protein